MSAVVRLFVAGAVLETVAVAAWVLTGVERRHRARAEANRAMARRLRARQLAEGEHLA